MMKVAKKVQLLVALLGEYLETNWVVGLVAMLELQLGDEQAVLLAVYWVDLKVNLMVEARVSESVAV
jgi:hypothetical protein